MTGAINANNIGLAVWYVSLALASVAILFTFYAHDSFARIWRNDKILQVEI